MKTNPRCKFHRLSNGLTILGEEIPSASSCAFSLLVPVGAALDPDGKEGSSTVMVEMFQKGAGTYDSRALSQAFEDIGAQRGASAGTEVSVFSAAILPEHLERVLDLHGVMLLQPQFPKEELGSVKDLCLQEIRSLEDEPSSKVMTELAKQFYPAPYGRSQLGTIGGVESISIADLQKHYRDRFLPSQAILGVAGKFDWERFIKKAEGVFSAWKGESQLLTVPPLVAENRSFHLQKDTSQCQIALAYPSVSHEHPDFYVAKVAIGILSGGMSGRLFIEVREKRGLVYRVSASHSALRGRGAVFAYAGTTPENAKETLSVMLQELRNMKNGVSEEELHRSKVDLKCRLIMQGESTSSRASALVNDWWGLGRVRPLDEIKAGIDAVSDGDIRRYSSEFDAQGLTLVTMGTVALEVA